jgi:hypothetical protein
MFDNSPAQWYFPCRRKRAFILPIPGPVLKKGGALKIFLCWSQTRSQKLAESMRNWLIHVIPGLSDEGIFFSPQIEKGIDWFEEVRRKLAEVDAALICLTPENIQSQWIHFEAGAVLGRLEKNRVFPYLLGIRSEDLKGPLSAFQGTLNNEEDTRRLAEDLCRLAGTKLPADYDTHWKNLKESMEKLKVDRISHVVANFRELFQRKTFQEELSECTHQTWVDRYSGARETLKTLLGHKAMIDRICEPYQKELFNQLISSIDGYAGLLKSFLIEEKKFWVSEAGDVDFTRSSDGSPMPGAVSAASERRLRQIQRLLFLLDSPTAVPVIPESIEFSRMTIFAERKELVRAKQRAINDGELAFAEDKTLRWRASIWELDRIVFYLLMEKSKEPSARTLAECIEEEMERLKAGEEKVSAMPLHYAIRALLAPGLKRDYPGLEALLSELEQYLEATGRDKGGKLNEI